MTRVSRPRTGRPRTGRFQRAASATTVVAVAGALIATATLYDGTPTTDVDLHDGGVWVTNSALNLVGHLNFQSRVLDGSVRTLSSGFDVAQHATTVIVADHVTATLSTLDPVNVTIGTETELPLGGEAHLGAGTVAVVSEDGRTVWAFEADQVASFRAETDEPVLELPAAGAVTVGTDGLLHAAAGGKIWSLADLTPSETAPESVALDGAEDGDDLAITTVGGEPVVLNRTSGELLLPGGAAWPVPDASAAVLQQPGEAADTVLLATRDALIQVALDGSEAVSAPAGGAGEPAPPVFLGGCAYGAWAGSDRYVRDCPGEDDDRAQDIPGGSVSGELRFRVNRDVVVLNNLTTGTVWLTDDALTQVENWQDVTPPAAEDEEIDDTVDATDELALPERQEENNPPVAEDDDLGVRPGRTTVLRVLENDSDPDGDILTAEPTSDPSIGTLERILGGAALQLTVPEDASGTTTFTYEAHDGRGESDSAQVRVTVRDWSVNEAPVQQRRTTLVVEQGRSAQTNVLTDWIDPDGDDIYLLSAAPTSADEVRFTADGRVTFVDAGTTVGRKTVVLTVSDGTETTEGELLVDVRPRGPLPPVAVADHATATVGEEVTVWPLDNDTDPNGDALRLASVEEIPGVTSGPDHDAGSVVLSSEEAGTYYLVYTVTDGPHSTPGIIRFDVVEPDSADADPIAVRDTALLPAGGEVYVDPLVNDIDPTGGVLVVQSVTVPADSGQQVAVIDHHLLRVSSTRALEGPAVFSYTISNGIGSAIGEVTVVEVPRPATLLPPVAYDDEARVRAGDVVDIDVLANDSHPNNEPIELEHDLIQLPESGEAFASEGVVRFRAPDAPGTVHLVYSVVDLDGQRDSAQVTIQVLPHDAERNSPPRPRDLNARVLAGSNVRVQVPLSGIDPDGDSVSLVGWATAPTKGTITEVSRDSFVYEAMPNAVGTDVFTYEVVDRLGARATATVRVGIAPPADSNQAPVAVDDLVLARPDRLVAVDALANDFDPDGDRISFVPEGIEVASGEVAPEIDGGLIELRTPAVPATVVFYYDIADGRGMTATGTVVVEVSEDAPLRPPVARDDIVLLADLAPGATTARVEVLENDVDPDGSTTDLHLTTAEENAQVEGTALVVTLTSVPQVLLYTITDVDDLSASAFVWVPALPGADAEEDEEEEELRDPPALMPSAALEVISGEELRIAVAEHVRVADGRTPTLTDVESVTAVNGDGSALTVDEHTLRFVSAADYYGPASISFRVTDGEGADDPDGLTSLLTLPITVLPPENVPPTFAGGSVQISPGEDPVTLDLRQLTTDPDPGDLDAMGYALTSSPPAGISASLTGSVLTVSAAHDTARGTTATLGVEVSDGSNDPVAGTVNVSVVASTRPLATVNDDVIDRADQGQAVTVNVLANDVSPFPGQPLSLVGQPAVETGTGTAMLAGEAVVVTPASDFVGTMVVRYRVADATGDPSREVDGRIRLTVQGRPAAPATPQVVEVRSRTVVLSWSPPANNGAEITGYTVTGGGKTTQCEATTCTIEGLANDVEHTFTVTATNEVGTSDPSPASAAARPDERPSTPVAPSVIFGDQSLDISWTAPTDYDGSPVESYTLEISPAPPSGSTQVSVTDTAYTWAGLSNGQEYRVRVQAHNRADSPSEWSGYGSEIPAGLPVLGAAPTTERLDPVGSQAQLRVSWPAAGRNGADISQYVLETLRGGSVVSSLEVGGDVTSQVVNLDTSESDYTFRVSARNRAGLAGPSEASAPRRAFVAPGAPTNVSASPGDNRLTITYGAAPGNGAAPSEIAYQYRLNGSGNWQAAPASGGVISTGVSNNSSYTVELRAVTAMDGVTYSGASVTTNQVAPYGVPNAPTITNSSASGQTVNFSWSTPARNGRDITMQRKIGNGSWTNTTATSYSQNIGYSSSLRLCVRTLETQDPGRATSESCRTQSTGAAPARAWISRGSLAAGYTASYHVRVNTENFPSGNYSYTCKADGAPSGWHTGTANFPANSWVQLACFTDYGGGSSEWIEVQIHGWGTTTRYQGQSRW